MVTVEVPLPTLDGLDWLEVVSSVPLGEVAAIFVRDRVTGVVGLWLAPRSRVNEIVAPRQWLPDPESVRHRPNGRAFGLAPLVRVRCAGDRETSPLLPGRSAMEAESSYLLNWAGQERERSAEGEQVVTILEGGGLRAVHRLGWERGQPALRCSTEIVNLTGAPKTVESLSSLSLCGISVFALDDSAPLMVHRLRSHWSGEGRPTHERAEDLHLERAYLPVSFSLEHFGQVGSTPHNGFASLVGVEDRDAGVTWGAQLHWGGSWQFELGRRDDSLFLACGQADFDRGHWRKVLQPGETLSSPVAVVTAVDGDFDDLCHALVSAQDDGRAAKPASEEDLAVQYNEYAQSWGNPTVDSVRASTQRLVGSGVRYLVIDCGWFSAPGADWGRAHGDWVVDEQRFPSGLAPVTGTVRAAGMVPGIWMEAENCGDASQAFHDLGRLLTRDGMPITSGNRRFFDLTDPATAASTGQSVANFLVTNGFGYLKLDYNASIGLGCDGAESLGEGLRRQVLGTATMLEAIRRHAPGVVIEVCSAGGHRNEPWTLSFADLASSTDAFEAPEIPLIAANAQRYVLPRKSLIWATLRQEDPPRQFQYKLASCFFGRMCLSGDIGLLDEAQWALVTTAIATYSRCHGPITKGKSRFFGSPLGSFRHPKGWQAVVRTSLDQRQALVVGHTFGGDIPAKLHVPLGQPRPQLLSLALDPEQAPAVVEGENLYWLGAAPWSAFVVLLGEPTA